VASPELLLTLPQFSSKMGLVDGHLHKPGNEKVEHLDGSIPVDGHKTA
jgi:hypothetical protein